MYSLSLGPMCWKVPCRFHKSNSIQVAVNAGLVLEKCFSPLTKETYWSRWRIPGSGDPGSRQRGGPRATAGMHRRGVGAGAIAKIKKKKKRNILFLLQIHNMQRGLPGGTVGKDLPANAGDTRDVGLNPGSRRSPGGGNGKPLQYSCLENPMDRGASPYATFTVFPQFCWLQVKKELHVL